MRNTTKCKSNHRLKFASSQFDWPKGDNSRIKKNNNNNQPMGVIFNKNTQLRRKLWPVPVCAEDPRRAAAAALKSKGAVVGTQESTTSVG